MADLSPEKEPVARKRAEARRGLRRGWRWALPLAWLVVVALGAAAAVAARSWLPYVVAGVVVFAGVVWVLVSVLSPAIPDRTCPACKKEGLVKLRRGEPGVRCELCGFRDDEMHVAYLDEW